VAAQQQQQQAFRPFFRPTMEMREVLSREGREAKNLLVYQFCDETTSSGASGSVGGGVGGGAGGDGGAAVGGGGVLLNGDCKTRKLLHFDIRYLRSFCSILNS